ncbi:MAG: inositol-3-phosphate synthase [Candidatus Aenigmarchaeota archaeon]|nr:inositol-3-phosphate synthase [Candidatus Aenigmarchaeota archaeon]
MSQIRIAITGVGNCASSLIQGIFYYKDAKAGDVIPGLMHPDLGGYRISDIVPVAAFDIDKRKVGIDLSKAIFAKPNCTLIFQKDIPNLGVEVKKAPVLDGFAPHMQDFQEDVTFSIDKNQKPVNIVDELKKSKADILINYLPVGSEEAVRHLAQCCLDAGVAMINCMPVFIATDPAWENKFKDKNLPIIGDDIKSEVGATIVHRTLAKLFSDRGIKIKHTYQLNFGGNTDFSNMLSRERLKSKKKSKTQSVQSSLPTPLEPENIHIGPSDYVPWLKDRKIAFIRLEGEKFGGAPIELELKLSVEDSPNSAGCVIDAIRCCKLALDRKTGGALLSSSSYFMKSPPQQFPDTLAREMLEQFIKSERER